MGIIFLILFTAAEIALVVLTFTKFGEKSAWRRNRTLIRLAEAALMLGIILLPLTHMKWRFAAVMFVLAVRFVIAAIMWLIMRGKDTGMKKKGWSVVNCVLSVTIITASLVPAFLFTNYNGLPTTGKLAVRQVSAILVDKNRTDPFEDDGSYREVPVHFYCPEEKGSYPLVIFSHGAFGYYESNYSTYAELAGNGYVVAALDHPHHSFFTEDTSGETVIVDTKFISDVMNINEKTDDGEIFELSHSWLKLRVDDENFVLDTIKAAQDGYDLDDRWFTAEKENVVDVLSSIDTERIGLMGHSLGGASSVTVGRERSDIDAVVCLDGTMLGEVKGYEDGKNVYYDEPYPVPLLDFTKDTDYNEREQYKNEHGYPYVNEYVAENALDCRIVSFADAEHMDFTDLPLISPFLGSMLGHGNVNSEEMMTEVNAIVLNWFNYYLKGEGTLDIQAHY